MIGNGDKDISLAHACVCVVNARSVDDYNRFSADFGLDDANLAGARLETLADLLHPGSDEVDELVEA